MRAILALCLALAFALPGLAQAQSAITRDFRDWRAVCEPDGYCAAATQSPARGSGADAEYVLTIGRQAQQTYWEIAFKTIATHGDEWSDFVVSVDDQNTTFSLAEEVGAYGTPDDFYLLGDEAQEVMDRMMPGSAVFVAFTDTQAAQHTVDFSLAGLTAAVIWIDDQQNRIGSERVASAAPHGLVPVHGGETDIPDVPTALLDRERADPECQPFEQLANGRDFTVDTLDEINRLYVVPCWSAAYNFGWKVYVESYDTFQVQYFANYGGADLGWMGSPFVVNFEYDPETKTLTDFNKARGVGDCGSAGTWKWNGYAFRMEEFRYKDCADAPMSENAELPEFPVIYAAPPAAPVAQ